MLISVVIGTYGDRVAWTPLAARAKESVESQTTPCEVIHHHGKTLAEARNAGAANARGEALVFLDADDRLDPHYIEFMTTARAIDSAPFSLYQPMTLGVREDGTRDDAPVFIEPGDLLERNFLPIGTMIPKSVFDSVGGFQEWEALEDWCLFLRCWRAGCAIRQAPGAIYEVTVRDGSRNSNQVVHHRIYNEIRARYR